MSITDDDRPAKRANHEIGCDLTFISADELSVRIELLQGEIRRLEQERASKQAGKLAAESLFRPTK